MTQPIKTATSVADQLKGIRRTGLLSLAVVIVIGGVFYKSTTDADHRIEKAVDDIIQTRSEARLTQCRRDNLIRHDAGEAAAKKAVDFINAQKAYSGAGPSTGKLKAAEDAYIESQRQVTLDAYPLRDCRPFGTDAYYENPPTPAPEEATCKPDGKGLCEP